MAAGAGNRIDVRSGLGKDVGDNRFAVIDDELVTEDDRLAIRDDGSVVDNDGLATEIDKKTDVDDRSDAQVGN